MLRASRHGVQIAPVDGLIVTSVNQIPDFADLDGYRFHYSASLLYSGAHLGGYTLMKSLFSAVAFLLLCSTVAFSDTLTISDGAASFEYRTDTAAGAGGNADWVLNGADLSFDEAWVLQIGGVGEELLSGTFTSLGADEGDLLFTGAGGDLELLVNYRITDLGFDEMLLEVTAELTNLSGTTIDGDLVNFIDYNLPDADPDVGFFDDLGGAPGDDVVVGADDILPNGSGHFADRFFEFVDGAELDGPTASDLLTRVRAGTTLGRTDNGFTSGDFKAAGGYSFSLGAGETDTFVLTAFAAAVPEPSSFLAFCLASFGLILRRKRALVA